MSRFSSTWRRLLTVVLVFLAAAALGFAPGYLTGLNGSNLMVLAAILPTIVTVGAGALLAYRSEVSPALTGGIILMFSAFLVIGVSHSSASGSYSVMIFTRSPSARDTCTCSGRPASVKPSNRQLGEYLSSGYSSIMAAVAPACLISCSPMFRSMARFSAWWLKSKSPQTTDFVFVRVFSPEPVSVQHERPELDSAPEDVHDQG